MSFTIIQNEKTPFQAIKTRSSKSRKIEIFPKGLTHGFGPKVPIFPKNGLFFNFFFQAVEARKMSFAIFQNEKTPFWAIKKRSSKSWKIYFFPRGLTHVLGPKVVSFLTFFQAIQARKMSLTIFQNEITFFQAIKTRSSNSRKIFIFPKGLSHGFCPKKAIFPNFFFRQYRPGKCFLRYSRTKKNAFLGYKNHKFKTSKNLHFSKGVNSQFWSKKGHFSNFFQAIQAIKMFFYDILERKKNAFLGYKNKKLKTSKN